MKQSNIPGPTVKRLSLYLRHLDVCVAEGKRTISSKQLGETLNLTDAQVRKDLAFFGPFGHPGIGYRVTDLAQRIRQILGTDIFAFSLSFDEIIIAIFLTDSETFTLPKQLYDELRYQMKPTIAAASTFVIVMSLLLLTTVALIQRRMARGQARVEPDS